MGQEYFINSQELESKVRDLLPSQGGAGAGFDLSASTQIIPIIDLTESAEGSNVRADLQTALSLTSITSFDVSNTTTTIVNNTGYFRIFGTYNILGSGTAKMQFTDGTTTKELTRLLGGSTNLGRNSFDFIVFMAVGDSLQVDSDNTSTRVAGNTRQIADIDGNLVNPL
jgi:hypothetical protein